MFLKYGTAVAMAVQVAYAYDSSLADCKEFAAIFSGSCGGVDTNDDNDYLFTTNDWVTSAPSINITCETDVLNQTMNCFDGSTPADSCVIQRRNCVTCSRDDAGIVSIHVQSNSQPNHCYGTKDANTGFPVTKEVDFSVRWNRDVLNETWTKSIEDIATTELMTALLCDEAAQNSSNIAAASSFTNNGDSIDGVVGLAYDNTLLINPTKTVGGVVIDAVYDNAGDFDGCLHTIYNDFLGYRTAGVCLKAGDQTSTSASPEMCEEIRECEELFNKAEWAFENGFAASDAVAQEPIGIALDGHIIVGPYNDDGELYVCADLDVCNGTFLDDSSYGYVMHDRFPYIVGCWGPAAPISTPVDSTCSVNACTKSAV